MATFKLTPLGVFVKNEGYTPIDAPETEDVEEEDDDEDGEMETEEATDT